MADLTLQVTPGEVLELYPAAKVEAHVQQREWPPAEWFIAEATADANGVATFTGVTPASRVLRDASRLPLHQDDVRHHERQVALAV